MELERIAFVTKDQESCIRNACGSLFAKVFHVVRSFQCFYTQNRSISSVRFQTSFAFVSIIRQTFSRFILRINIYTSQYVVILYTFTLFAIIRNSCCKNS